MLWESEVWIDGRLCDAQDSLVTPHRHRLGRLSPGKHLLTLRVNNAMIHPIGDRGHTYTEHMQTIWNGVVGCIELRAHALVRIARQRVFPNNNGSVRIEATIRSEQRDSASGSLVGRIVELGNGKVVGTGRAEFSIPRGDHPNDAQIADQDCSLELTIKPSDAAKLWSEFSPELYRAEVELRTAGEATCGDSHATTFGFREIRRQDRKLLINGRPTFIRGNLDCVHFPLTGYPPCDVESWRRVFRIYKQYGLNQVRFHSWCPPEAAFRAADELGIYIQAEVVGIDAWMADPHSDVLCHPKGVGRNDRTTDPFVAPKCGGCWTPTETIPRSCSS